MNRNVFVFGIGGTGARVIRSLTMLLASGAKINDTNKIIPIIIDVDSKNADTSRTLKALESYKVIREKGYGNHVDDGFFSANLNTLSSLKTENDLDDMLEDSFQLKFENLESSFIRYIDPQDELRHDETMDLLEALYDDTPPGHENFSHTELNLRLDLGFKGNPNIGCVVFNSLAATKEFRFVLKSINENDRIFIISSIFGGTGSSGFPQLIRLLQENDKIRKNHFGALTVMPYFNVTDKKGSAIDGDRFNSKTEAALSYYSKYLKNKINCFYQIWDKPIKQYDNHEGGIEQKNSAHIVEMIGATAIIDFANKSENSIKNDSTEYFDFGIKAGDDVINLSHFFDVSRKNIAIPLTLFTYAMKVYLEVIPKLQTEAFYIELNLSDKLSTDTFFKNLTAFFKDHYKQWLNELKDNERSFQPFQHNAEDLNSMVTAKPIKVKTFLGMTTEGGITEHYLKTELGLLENNLKKTISDSELERRFLKLLNEIAQKCYAKLHDLPIITETS